MPGSPSENPQDPGSDSEAGEGAMAERVRDPRMHLGIYGRPAQQPRLSATEIIAGALTVIWLLSVALFLFGLAPETRTAVLSSADPLTMVLTVLSVLLPIALIWIVATTARTLRELRGEAARLQGAIDAVRHTVNLQGRQPVAVRHSVDPRPPAAPAGPRSDAGRGLFDRRVPPPRVPADDQAALSFGTGPDEVPPPIPVATYVHALNFPEGPEDAEGFRALRLALANHDLAKLIRASQDVLTLLSQSGIYMDDLTADRARPEFWRRFAAGERGRAIAMLGGVRDRQALSAVATRMRADTIFRDAAHHFLRQFDRSFSAFEATATDAEIVALSSTRTARAFMLVGRVTGTFD